MLDDDLCFADEVLKAVSHGNEDEEGQGRVHSAHEHDSIVLKYKELIREQVRPSPWHFSVCRIHVDNNAC